MKRAYPAGETTGRGQDHKERPQDHKERPRDHKERPRDYHMERGRTSRGQPSGVSAKAPDGWQVKPPWTLQTSLVTSDLSQCHTEHKLTQPSFA